MSRSHWPSTVLSTWLARVSASGLVVGGIFAMGQVTELAAADPLPTPSAPAVDVDANPTAAVPGVPSSTSHQAADPAEVSPLPAAAEPSQTSPSVQEPPTGATEEQASTGRSAGGAENSRTGSGSRPESADDDQSEQQGPGISNLAVDPGTGYYLHPRTGFLVVPETGQMLTPGSLADTGYRYSFISGRVLYTNPETMSPPSPVPASPSRSSQMPSEPASADPVKSAEPTGDALAAPSTASRSDSEPSTAASATRATRQSLVQPLANAAVAVIVGAGAVLYYLKVFRRPAMKAKP